ncbi:MAG: DUF2321 domain-containing protein [Gammaproteobacteria bacterium]|nr:DUF2321 domain-containing protein [Gammaproteobacteria bacterium]MDE0411897.1 DUF2321 domain-containing protein [Gammaproteobacteria bacterium]
MRELAEELPELEPGDRKMLKAVIEALSLDSPRKGLAAHRCSKISIKKLKSGTPDIQKFIMLNVISETTKKLLFGD